MSMDKKIFSCLFNFTVSIYSNIMYNIYLYKGEFRNSAHVLYRSFCFSASGSSLAVTVCALRHSARSKGKNFMDAMIAASDLEFLYE